MYVKVNNGVVEKFPYSIADLRQENPQTSFPVNPSKELLEEFGIFMVVSTGVEYDPETQTATQQGCIYNEDKQRWETAWVVNDLSVEEISQRKAVINENAIKNRLDAYRNEADPLFFKWQRGEATQQEWMGKVAEIKQRYPKAE